MLLYPPGPPDILPELSAPGVVPVPGVVAVTEPVAPEVVPVTTVTWLLVEPIVVPEPGALPVAGVDVPVVTFAVVFEPPVGEL